jgi:hypothetical protein
VEEVAVQANQPIEKQPKDRGDGPAWYGSDGRGYYLAVKYNARGTAHGQWPVHVPCFLSSFRATAVCVVSSWRACTAAAAPFGTYVLERGVEQTGTDTLLTERRRAVSLRLRRFEVTQRRRAGQGSVRSLCAAQLLTRNAPACCYNTGASNACRGAAALFSEAR